MNSLSRVTSMLVLLLLPVLPLTAAAADNAGSDGDDTAAATPTIASLPHYLAELTRRTAEQFVEQVTKVVRALGPSEEGPRAIDWDHVGSVAAELAIVVVATIVLFFAFRRLLRIRVRWVGGWTERAQQRVALQRRLIAVVRPQ